MNTKNTYIEKRRLLHRKKKLRSLISISLMSLISIISLIFILNKSLNSKVKIASINTENIFTVVIDAGHGDWDTGTIGLNNSHEKDITLAVSLKLGELLESQNINVIYTRTTDKSLLSDDSRESLYERVKISNENNADLFISIHCNGTEESPDYNGIETWYDIDDEKSSLLAELVQNELSALEYTSDRGTKPYDKTEPLIVLEHTTAPSILVELGFISNFSDEAFLTSKYGQVLSAEAIYNAILTYKDTLN